jgi:molybdate transport system regulatory protein
MAKSVGSQRSGRRVKVQTVTPNIVTLRVRTKIWLEYHDRFVIGDGGLRLLEAVAGLGSLAAAVREIGWSYRHAWGYLRNAETILGTPLLVPRPGKGRQRGALLTAHGRALVRRLSAARTRINAVVGRSGPTAPEIAARGGRRAEAWRRVRPGAAAGSR